MAVLLYGLSDLPIFIATSSSLSLTGCIFLVSQDTSWTVTIIFVILIGWYVMMLVIHCCKAKYQKEEDLEAAAKSRKEGGETDSEEKPFTDKSNDDEMSD